MNEINAVLISKGVRTEYDFWSLWSAESRVCADGAIITTLLFVGHIDTCTFENPGGTNIRVSKDTTKEDLLNNHFKEDEINDVFETLKEAQDAANTIRAQQNV